METLCKYTKTLCPYVICEASCRMYAVTTTHMVEVGFVGCPHRTMWCEERDCVVCTCQTQAKEQK